MKGENRMKAIKKLIDVIAEWLFNPKATKGCCDRAKDKKKKKSGALAY